MANLYKVFVGCPFTQPLYGHYERLKKEVEAESPLEIVLPDKAELSSAGDLLGHIDGLIRESAACIFDVTGANPNVTLEVGIAHTVPVKFVITVNPEKLPETGSKTGQGPERLIIADLRGRVRIEYTTYDELKDSLYRRYFPGLELFKRWRRFRRSHRAYESYALDLFQEWRAHGRSKSPKITGILDGSGLHTKDLVRYLKDAKLISLRRGRDGGYYYPSR